MSLLPLPLCSLSHFYLDLVPSAILINRIFSSLSLFYTFPLYQCSSPIPLAPSRLLSFPLSFLSLPPSLLSFFTIPTITLSSSLDLVLRIPSHPLLLLESYRTRFLRAEGASDDSELAALAHLVEKSCKISTGGTKLPTSFPSVRGGLR